MRYVSVNQQSELLDLIQKISDVAIVLFSFVFAHWIRFGHISFSLQHLLLCIVSILLIHVTFCFMQVYGRSQGILNFPEFRKIVLSLAMVVMWLALVAYVFKIGEQYSRLYVGIAYSVALFLLLSYRVIARTIFSLLIDQGYYSRRVLLIGAGTLGQQAASAIEVNKWSGMELVGILDDNPKVNLDEFKSNPDRLGSCLEVGRVVEEFRCLNTPIDHVWIALPTRTNQKIKKIIEQLSDSATSVSIIPDFFELHLKHASFDSVSDIPLINLSQNNILGVNLLIKRSMDFILAFFLTIGLLPIMVLIAVAIKLDSKGPVFFLQSRYGIDGKEINVWKFRSTYTSDDGIVQARRHDSRVTRVGFLLRKTSLDELPQLFNVVLGSMSLVGPRPHAVAHNEMYRKTIKGYMSRHQIKPGITGLAQISGCRGETETVQKMKKRIEFDLFYIRSWSLILDLKIMMLTIKQVFLNKNVY